MRRGIRFPQWWMLLVASLSILSGQGSLVGMERFAKRHHQALNELLGTDFQKSPSDSTFRLLLAQLDVPGFESLPGDWMAPRQLLQAVELEGVLIQADALDTNHPFSFTSPSAVPRS